MKKSLFILIIFSLLIFTACDPDQAFLDNYNKQLDYLSYLRGVHDFMINDINNNVTTQKATDEKLNKYIDWVDQNEPVFVNFTTLVKKNKWNLKAAKEDPDAILTDINKVIATFEENKAKFEKFLEENSN